MENNTKMIATRSCLLKLQCTRFDFDWGSTPDPAGGSSQRSPRAPSCISEVLLLRKKEKKQEEGEREETKN